MDLKELIKTGPISRAQRIVLFGPNGDGKSTLAAQSPGALFLDTEDGSTHLPVNRIAVADYNSLCNTLKLITETDYPCRTAVLDTIDRAELFMRQEVCKDLHISGLEAKPYGKAFQFLFEKFDEFLTKQLDPLIAAGIHVLVVGHSNVRRVQFPGLDAFDRWELKLHQSCANRLKEWSDAVLFLNWELHVVENEGKPKRCRWQGTRYLHAPQRQS